MFHVYGFIHISTIKCLSLTPFQIKCFVTYFEHVRLFTYTHIEEFLYCTYYTQLTYSKYVLFSVNPHFLCLQSRFDILYTNWFIPVCTIKPLLIVPNKYVLIYVNMNPYFPSQQMLSNTLHKNGFFPVCILKCLLNLLLLADSFWHMLDTYGFSTVCTLRCVFKVLLILNSFSTLCNLKC